MTTVMRADHTQPSLSTQTLSREELQQINAYWRAANYLSVGQIYLYANELCGRAQRVRVLHSLTGSTRQIFF